MHDDLTDDVRARHDAGSSAAALATEILTLVRRDTVVVLTLEPQLERQEWMREWFGETADGLVERCRRLNALL